MANVAVTCIKNGRSDSFGRPLVSGTYYPSVEIETAKALWNSGYVSVADASVFDQDPLAGTSPLDDFNIARALSLSRQPEQTSANLAAELAALGAYVQLSPKAGLAGNYGYGVGPCPFRLPEGFVPMSGVSDPLSDGYGGYLTQDGSVMRWRPAEYRKWGTGTNGLALNSLAVLPATSMSIVEANNQGFMLPREFYNAGVAQPGFFIDQYVCSKALYQGRWIAVSVKNAVFLSSNAANNPISALDGSPSNTHAGFFAAAKTRGSAYFPAIREMYANCAFSALAHAQASQGTAACAWFDGAGTTNFPKGCNSVLNDINDGGVTYTASGYSNAGLTGSGTPFAKTTHNGQNCGICDLAGPIWAFSPGITALSGNYYALKLSVDIASLTGGSTLATDAFGATGIAANYDLIGPTFGAYLGGTSVYTYGSASQVFSEQMSGNAWRMTSLGIPLATGVGGTNAYGQDAFYDNRTDNMAVLSGGRFSAGTLTGVWGCGNHLNSTSDAGVGFRCARYLDAGSF